MKRQILFILLTSILLSCEKNNEPVPEIKACFEFQINGDEVQFTNCSENASYYHWDFGDGTTSNIAEPLHVYQGDFPYIVKLAAFRRYRGFKFAVATKTLTSQIEVLKPNIYIYPQQEMDVSVKISFPMGGHITASIPNYADGWHVNVNKNGTINGEYNYLFYESIQANIFQYNQGWCIKRENLKSFFEENMHMYNFSETEIKDFIGYWIPLLNENDYYNIYPQTNEIIDQTIQLDFSVQPNNISRLFYGIMGTNNYSNLEEPTISPFVRNGFYVVEWGVFLE